MLDFIFYLIYTLIWLGFIPLVFIKIYYLFHFLTQLTPYSKNLTLICKHYFGVNNFAVCGTSSLGDSQHIFFDSEG